MKNSFKCILSIMAGVMLAIMLYGCNTPKFTHPRGDKIKRITKSQYDTLRFYKIEKDTVIKGNTIRIKGWGLIEEIDIIK